MASRLCLATLVVALSACGVPSSPPNEDPVLQRGLSAQPESLDPQLARSVASGKVLGDMYEGLYTRDAAGQRVAGVIEDGGMALSGDARRYTFTLRTDARWSDGSPVTAADFVRGWRFLADPDNAAFYADLITPLENARDIAIGAKLPSTLGVSARDAHTLDVVLTAPQPDFLERLAHPALAPRAPDANLTNGAYRLASVASGGVVSMHANPYFHAADTVAIKAVNYTSYEQEQTEYNAFRSGALDITSRVPRQLFLGDAPKPDTLRVTPYLGVAFLTMNMREPPSLALRRALSLAIDRVALAEDVLARGETPAYGLVPPGTRNGEEDYQVYLPDHAMLDATARIAAARTAMAQAMATAERAPQITLSYASSDENRVVALALQAMWREVLPELTVTLINKEFRVLLAEARSGQFDGMIRSSWVADFNDPMQFLNVLGTGAPANSSAFSDSRFDTLLMAANATDQPSRRASSLRAAEQIAAEQVPVIPLYYFVSKHLVSKRVQGWQDNPLDSHYSRYLSIETVPARDRP